MSKFLEEIRNFDITQLKPLRQHMRLPGRYAVGRDSRQLEDGVFCDRCMYKNEKFTLLKLAPINPEKEDGKRWFEERGGAELGWTKLTQVPMRALKDDKIRASILIRVWLEGEIIKIVRKDPDAYRNCSTDPVVAKVLIEKAMHEFARLPHLIQGFTRKELTIF